MNESLANENALVEEEDGKFYSGGRENIKYLHNIDKFEYLLYFVLRHYFNMTTYAILDSLCQI